MTRACGHRCVICDGAAYLSDDFRHWAWLMGRIADIDRTINDYEMQGKATGGIRQYRARLDEQRKAAWEAMR